MEREPLNRAGFCHNVKILNNVFPNSGVWEQGKKEEKF
ncbi:Uncharacterized protein dnm_027520 [Desulfonema magnum]|uniref:Uncharacterized protein n=1 Tax=Desulfonema magnum TaxID=45655 RepID=A0A975GNC2_9BACT|nr:Uncharacterized protein dnm_027520 [Desulfonema magnum]